MNKALLSATLRVSTVKERADELRTHNFETEQIVRCIRHPALNYIPSPISQNVLLNRWKLSKHCRVGHSYLSPTIKCYFQNITLGLTLTVWRKAL